MRQVYQISHDGGILGVVTGPDSVVFFFSKTKRKEEKLFFYFPAYFYLVLHSRFKTKRSLRSDVDRSTDRQIDRQDDYCNPLPV